MTNFDEVLEARGEYDRAKMAYEKAHTDLYYARKKWELLHADHQRELIDRAMGKTASNEGKS